MNELRERKTSGLNREQLLTVGDLEDFKADLLKGIKEAFKELQGITPKKWIKTRELRKLVPISPGTLQTMRQNGTLRYSQIGGAIYYDPADVQKMFEQHIVHKKRML